MTDGLIIRLPVLVTASCYFSRSEYSYYSGHRYCILVAYTENLILKLIFVGIQKHLMEFDSGYISYRDGRLIDEPLHQQFQTTSRRYAKNTMPKSK